MNQTTVGRHLRAAGLSLFAAFIPLPASSQEAPAPVVFDVSREGFKCLMQNISAYARQGEEIIINFENCPSAPGLAERMRARQATMFLPRKRIQADAAEVRYRDVVALTPELLVCLRDRREEVLATAVGEVVTLFPDACRP